MNVADLATLLAFFGCPAVAGLVAARQAGWFTILFVVLGLAVGFAAAVGVHKLAYRLLEACLHPVRGLSGMALLFGYMLVPVMAAFGAMVVTGWSTAWLVRHAL